MNIPGIVERLVPGINRCYGEGSAILRQHLTRYRLACAYIRDGDEVLDVACGAGYGSFLLAEAGGRVTGIDRDADILAYAAATYAHPHTSWMQADLDVLPAIDSRFNRIVCFETIEHMRGPDALIRRLANLLKPGGLLLCSAPIVPTAHFDPFHLHDFTRETFTALLTDAGFTPLDSFMQEDTILTLIGTFSPSGDLEPHPVAARAAGNP